MTDTAPADQADQRPEPPADPPTGAKGLLARLMRLRPASRAAIALVAPVTAIVSTLLAVGIISPRGAADALAAGAEGSLRAGSSKLVLRVESTEDGTVTRFSATGHFDYQTGRGRLLYSFAGTEGLAEAARVETRFDGGVPFIRMAPGVAEQTGARWVEVDGAVDEVLRNAAEAELTDVQIPDFAAFSDLNVGDPSAFLSELKRAGEVEEVGETVIFGSKTVGYRGTISSARGGRLTATAWIGRDDLIRRLELYSGGNRFRATLEFSEYGAPVDVEVPPREQVIKASELITLMITGG